MIIEYVASGAAHLRLANRALPDQPEVQAIVNEFFADLNNKRPGRKFSLLFNAFVEPDFGKRFLMFKDSLYSIHSDSGGLQIVTRGDEITDTLKDKIYRTQALYSDIAMCFDEIPVKTIRESSDRNDTTGRIFDAENLEELARKTGRNIKRQIEIFQEENSSSRPMIIAQGNCYETYNKWIDCLLKEIPSSQRSYIGGVAMGAAALGTGVLEDIERAVYAVQLAAQIGKSYVHVLGVGSIRRMLPYLALIRSGYYPKDIHLSYDSTTHTLGISNGLYYLKDGIKKFKTNYVDIFHDIDKKYNFSKKGVDVMLFHKLMHANSSYYHDREKDIIDLDKMKEFYYNRVGFATSSMENFMDKIDECLSSDKHIIRISDEIGVVREIHGLLQVKTLDDFLHWKKIYGGTVKSKRIGAEESSTLENFFA